MSIYNWVKEHYNQMPEWALQTGSFMYYKIPERIRYGKDFYNTTAELKKTEYLSREEINTIINERFLYTFRHAYTHVPFYKKYYSENSISVDDIHDINDISKLPFIDKSVLRDHCEELIADDVNKNKLLYLTTSGSTGSPVGLFQPPEMTMIEWAYTLHIWSRIGYRPNSSRFVLRGKKIYEKSKDPELFYDPLRRELSGDIYNLDVEKVKKYCTAIEKYKPDYIHGYMSAIILFAKYVELNGIELKHRFKGILATSETILPDQKEYVEKILKARVFSFYGHTERLVIAGECEKSGFYHVEPLYGYCEVIDENGNQSDYGEIVATGFLNNAMPLIRYKTGDIAKVAEKCECGRNVRLIERVEGRTHLDVLINKNNNEVPMTAFNNIHAPEFDKIIRYKLIQNEIGKAIFRIQVADNFERSDERVLKELMESKANNLISFEVEVVETIPVQPNGKYRVVEQNIL